MGTDFPLRVMGKQDGFTSRLPLEWISGPNILAVLAVLFLIRGLLGRFTSPLRKYPGPLIASFSNVWKAWIVYKGRCEHDHIDLHNKYGPIVRTGPNELSFASPDAAKDILTSGKGVSKTDFYWVFPPPGQPDVFTEIREWKHAQLKRSTVKPYNLTSMQKSTAAIEDVERELIEKLDALANHEGAICDLGNWLHWFAFDVLGEVAFSHRYGFLRNATDVENCISTIDHMQFYDGLVGQIPWLHYFLLGNPIIYYLLTLKPILVTRMALGEMQQRKLNDHEGRQKGGRDDLLAQLLQAHNSSPDKFSEGDVFAVAHGAIFAGSDSTASTMQSFFWLLLNSPQSYQKLLDEIDTAESNGLLSEMVTFAEAQDLPYFQACLNEAMRLRPAVGLNIYRKLPPEGLTIDGTFYPGGTEVAVNGWVLHRNKDVFGPDAELYRPERWLEPNAKRMQRYMYQFGGGSHLCLGRNLALYEMNKVLPQLLRRYHFELVHPGRPLKHHTSFFVVQNGLEVFISHRNATATK